MTTTKTVPAPYKQPDRLPRTITSTQKEFAPRLAEAVAALAELDRNYYVSFVYEPNRIWVARDIFSAPKYKGEFKLGMDWGKLEVRFHDIVAKPAFPGSGLELTLEV